MSSLRSALDEMASIDNRNLTLGELDQDITELLEAQNEIEVRLAEKTKAVTERAGH